MSCSSLVSTEHPGPELSASLGRCGRTLHLDHILDSLRCLFCSEYLHMWFEILHRVHRIRGAYRPSDQATKALLPVCLFISSCTTVSVGVQPMGSSLVEATLLGRVLEATSLNLTRVKVGDESQDILYYLSTWSEKIKKSTIKP
nr:hypothetical protein CFP56_65859 [Quercus suber]